MDKPWTAPGLTAEERIGLIADHHMIFLRKSVIKDVVELLHAHARDAAPKWTRVADELPPVDTGTPPLPVMVPVCCAETGRWGLACWLYGKWIVSPEDVLRTPPARITHWLKVPPMPEPPREGAP